MADTTLLIPETQAFAEMQEKGIEAQAFAKLLSTPDKDGKVGTVTDASSLLRVQYNDGSSTRIHTSESFNFFLSEFIKDNADELVTRTMSKVAEMVKAQQVKAAQEIEAKLNFSKYIPGTGGIVSAALPVITSQALAVGYTGDTFTYYLTAKAQADDPVLLYAASGLPTGLSIDSKTGVITGSVATAGVYTVTLTAQNLAGSTQQVLQIVIADAPTPPATPSTPTSSVAPTIYGAMSATAKEGTAFTFQINASNLPSSGVTYSATGLPSGLSCDANTGAITGSPDSGTAASSPYTVILQVTAPDGTDTETLNLTVTV